VMRSPLIDTEPSFSRDGKWLFFTSDRGGSPQVYRVPVDGGVAQRVTVNGSYNISPQVSPSEENLVYVSRRHCALRLTILVLHSEEEQLISSAHDHQCPSVAPNGQQILYSARQGGKSVLRVSSVDGGVCQALAAWDCTVHVPTRRPST